MDKALYHKVAKLLADYTYNYYYLDRLPDNKPALKDDYHDIKLLKRILNKFINSKK